MKAKLDSLWQFLRSHRVIVTITLALLITAGAYVLWSMYTWDSYKVHEKEWRHTVQAEFDIAINMRPEDDKGRQDKLVALEKPVKTISERQDTACKINALVEWQRWIKPLGDSERECLRVKDQFDKLKGALNELAAYVRDEYAVAEILDDVPLGKVEAAEDSWEDTATIWRQTTERLDKLIVHESFKPTKQIALRSVGAVSAAWQEVLAATTAKDKVRYENAQTMLAQAYSGMSNITDMDTKQLHSLSDALASIIHQ